MITAPEEQTIDDYAHEDIFDSRDAQQRIDYLEGLNDSAADNLDGHMDPEDYSELLAWRAFLAEQTAADWSYGESFISDDYFEDYARELAEDIGAIKDDASWPMTYIDWPAAAEALKQDYSSVELAGHTFWYRS